MRFWPDSELPVFQLLQLPSSGAVRWTTGRADQTAVWSLSPAMDTAARNRSVWPIAAITVNPP